MAAPDSTRTDFTFPLQAAARAIELLLNEDDLLTAIEQSLALIGTVADQDRAYLFSARSDPEHPERVLISQQCEWVRPGIRSEMDNPELADIDFERTMPRWYHTLRSGGHIAGPLRTFSREEQEILTPQGIHSLLVVPVFDRETFRGFIGFDNCRVEYAWSEQEKALLHSISSAIGIAMGRQENAEILEASENRFRRMLDNISTVAVRGCSATGVIHYWNPVAETLYGYSREEALGQNMFDLLTPGPLRAHARKRIQHLAEGKEVPAEETTLNRKNGEQVNILTSQTRVEQPGRPDEFFALDMDLTSHKKLEHLLLRSQRMEAVGSLAGGIAHDLNNLLSPMLMSVGLLKSKENDPQRNEILEMMETSIHRATDMILQVLAFERGMDGKKVDVDPVDILHDLEHILAETLPRNITLEITGAKDLPHLNGDPTQIHQVLMNLCLNARDAMPHGGELRIKAAERELRNPPQSAIGATLLPGRYLRLSVRDTGSGISQESLLRIFEPFFTTKSKDKGTGLGLATSLAILKSHGGAISVDSILDKGTTFTLYLPVALHAAADSLPEADGEIRLGNGERVLVVDDEQSIRDITREILTGFGYHVHLAEHGLEAVEYFREHHRELSLVLTDLMMPVMDGAAAMRRMREIDPAVPILATSGLSSNVCKPNQPPEDADMFIPKPYRTEELLHRIQILLDRRR